MLELAARGSSHIASTRKRETRDRAIAEVLEEFSEVHGLQRLNIFRELLAEGGSDRRRWTKRPAPEGRRKKALAIAEGQRIGQNLRDEG